jgi:hypothetical protein
VKSQLLHQQWAVIMYLSLCLLYFAYFRQSSATDMYSYARTLLHVPFVWSACVFNNKCCPLAPGIYGARPVAATRCICYADMYVLQEACSAVQSQRSGNVHGIELFKLYKFRCMRISQLPFKMIIFYLSVA